MLFSKQNYVVLILTIFLSVFANANLKQEIDQAAQALANQGNQLALKAAYYTNAIDPDQNDYLFLDDALNKLLDAIVRKEGRIPAVVGDVGAGKSALIQKLAQTLADTSQLPDSLHKDLLSNYAIVSISGRNFEKGSGALELKSYLLQIEEIFSKLDKIPLIVINETQFLQGTQFSILTEYAKLNPEAAVILEVNDTDYSNAKSSVPGFARYAVPVRVPQYTEKQVLEILKSSEFVHSLKNRTAIEITDEAIVAAVNTSADYRTDLAEPTRSLQLLDDAATALSRLGQQRPLTKADVYSFVAKKSGVKVVPQDREKFAEHIEELRTKVKSRVLGQDPIVDGLVDQLKAAMTSQGRKHSIGMIMGPTGVGKTYGAEVLAEEFYGSKERVLELDMTQFSDKNSVTVLLGAPNGYISSDKAKGVLCEFLDGAGQGGGVIIMNEFEEAHSEAVTRLMEMFDQGHIRCGDGKLRYLGRSLIVMTSNKNSESLLPNERIKNINEEELEKVVSGITQDQMKTAWTEKKSYTESSDNQVKTAVVERIDRYYYAKPLLPSVAIDVMKLEVNKYAKEQKAVEDIDMEVSEDFSKNLLGAFYNQENGARQIRTMVQQTLSKAIAEFRKEHGYNTNEFVVTAKLHQSRKTDSIITITDKETGKSISIDGPRVPVTNKLFDPNVRGRLQKLEANLKAEVFGQDESIASVVGAAKARFLKPDSQKAVAGFLIGTTGTGKTQLAKTLTKSLYGREDALALFEMGRVSDQHDLNDILSPPKGIIGSDQPGQLESFLQAFPDGGVLLFDEMSNVGGNDMGLKNAVFKQFYGMLEEGVYKSPSGKTYDLSKYIILFTGNEGEEIFKGLSSDNMIDETYADATKNPETVKDVLRGAGVPDAFIGRLAFVTLMRPATSQVRQLIAKKMLKDWVKEVESSQPIDVKYPKDFTNKLADLMFSPQAGARSILQFLDVNMSQVVANAALELDWDALAESGDRAELQLEIDSHGPTKPFYEGDTPDSKSAILKVTAKLQNQVIAHEEIDFTGKANFMPQVHSGSAKATAAHEMGHLITAFTSATGKKPIIINIVPEKIGSLTTAGYVQYKRVPIQKDGAMTRDRLVKEAAGMLAGSEAETLISGADRNTGRSNDLQKTGSMIRQSVLENHMIPELDGAEAFNNGQGDLYASLPADKKKLFDNYVDAILKDARALAVDTIKENAHLIVAGVELLMKHGRLNEQEIERLLAKGEEVKKEAGWLKQNLVKYSGGYITADKLYSMNTDGIVLKNDCEKLLGAN